MNFGAVFDKFAVNKLPSGGVRVELLPYVRLFDQFKVNVVFDHEVEEKFILVMKIPLDSTSFSMKFDSNGENSTLLLNVIVVLLFFILPCRKW